MSDPQSDPQLLAERLQTVLTALERIPQRFAAISAPADFFVQRKRNRADGCDLHDPDCRALAAWRRRGQPGKAVAAAGDTVVALGGGHLRGRYDDDCEVTV